LKIVTLPHTTGCWMSTNDCLGLGAGHLSLVTPTNKSFLKLVYKLIMSQNYNNVCSVYYNFIII